ncbi:MAG: phosphoenolpyruvate-utilizing N-terminal domain-containing protein [Polyangiaceae bacterium]
MATPASTGLARGFARLCQCALTPVVHRRSIDPGEVESELRRFDDAVATVEAELERLREEVSQTIGEVEAGVFDVHVLMLRESKLRSAVHRLCRDAAMNVEPGKVSFGPR